jgi:PPOX class probable F420-dependent enzyme
MIMNGFGTDREAFFAEPQIAVLVTLRKDGRPHAGPVWYSYENGDFLVSVGKDSAKVRQVQRDPRVSLVIDRRERPYFAVTVEGTATVEGPMSFEQRAAHAGRYLGPEEGRRYAEVRPAEGTLTLRIRPERFLEFGHVENDSTKSAHRWVDA